MSKLAQQVAQVCSQNSSFSQQIPGLQLAIDSTSLGAFKTCPRYYLYSIVLGFQPKGQSPHLAFGSWLHKAREEYEKAKCAGAEHPERLELVMQELLEWTWNKKLQRGWLSTHESKNRKSLVQTVFWYLEQWQDDPLETVVLANGSPAVELPFRFESGTEANSGEPFLLCGHLDRIAKLGSTTYIPDIKTTGSMLTSQWFKSWSPSNQFTLYTIAGQVAFGEPVAGVIVDGIQVGATFARFQRGPVQRPQGVLDEWMEELPWWLRGMEQCAEAGSWPQNDKACDMYGGCPFRGICSLAPSQRDPWLRSEFQQRVWDPLAGKGKELQAERGRDN